MVEVKEILLKDTYGINFLLLDFIIKDTEKDLADYRFDIYRSFDPVNFFTLVAYDVKDFRFIDTNIDTNNIGVTYYYKIKVTDTVTPGSTFSQVVSYTMEERDMYAATLLDIHDIYFTNIIKDHVYFLRKRHTGQKCTCYDTVRKKADPNCTLCFGTRYVGGYFEPVSIAINWAHSMGETYREKFTPSDIALEEEPAQFWTHGFPPVKIEDIIYDNKTKHRYLVIAMNYNTKKDFFVRQICQVQRIPKSNIVYQFPITF
jgi:hypothetical protein